MELEENIIRIREDLREVKIDVKYVKEKLEKSEMTFREHEEWIKKIEKEQVLLSGKFAMIIIGIGGLVTFVFNFIMWIWNKVNK